jgi:hypothetical protein
MTDLSTRTGPKTGNQAVSGLVSRFLAIQIELAAAPGKRRSHGP